MDYVVLMLALIATYGLAAQALDVLVSDLGLPVVCTGLTIATGAYSSALLTTQWHVAALPALLLGCLLGSVVGSVFGVASGLLSSDRLLLFSFFMQSLGSSVLDNASALTRGPAGVGGILPLVAVGPAVSPRLAFAVAAIVALVCGHCLVTRARHSAFGRVLWAIRENEEVAQAFGKNCGRVRLIAFSLFGGLSALAGGVLAHGIGFVDPSMFTLVDSVMVLAMVIAGGARESYGPLLGAALVLTLPECLRFVGVSGDIEAQARQALFGLLLVLLILVRPRAAFGDKA